ncbi:hypothetical protein TESG_03648 [Trichophyton tonsurans CBS 112818]|uniref:Uncharacterized protein n=1 Tax=Trichophyton tonsurans (strain CBS 112818) TaxID=647933 RepID=F2RXZ6_TRIT1|nr:hypothetical protein TESG_03648 [Trichophyton tonsurans CBS 112818]
MVKDNNLGEANIYSTPCGSGSKVNISQYLLLRSVWFQHPKTKDKDVEKWGIKEFKQADKWLGNNGDWSIYLENLSQITNYTGPPRGLGTFSYVWFTHHQVISLPKQYEHVEDQDRNVSYSPISSRLRSAAHKANMNDRDESPTPLGKKGYQTPPDQITGYGNYSPSEGLAEGINNMTVHENSKNSPSEISNSDATMSPASARRAFPKVEDEQIVNGYLIALLASICMYHPDVSLHWSPVRKSFRFGKRDVEPNSGDEPYLFEARTDGHLASRDPGPNDEKPSAVIVEVKPTNRQYNNRVIYQATSQMVSWIYQEPDAPGAKKQYRRPMIIQEREQIRLIIATYDQKYIDYLYNKPLSGPEIPLMTMNELFVWDITKRHHMEICGPVLLALALQNGKLEN